MSDRTTTPQDTTTGKSRAKDDTPGKDREQKDRTAPDDAKRPDKAGKDHADVRVAGRREMRDPPRRWDRVDEQGDESFPASDPPGNY